MILEWIAGVILISAWPLLKMVRCLHSVGWDRSNATNFVRTESYTTMYPYNLPLMVVLTDEQKKILADAGITEKELVHPFKYVSGDEFSDHFPYSRSFEEKK